MPLPVAIAQCGAMVALLQGISGIAALSVVPNALKVMGRMAAIVMASRGVLPLKGCGIHGDGKKIGKIVDVLRSSVFIMG